MKHFFQKITLGLALAGMLLTAACTKNFEEINTDPNSIPVALPQQLLAPALASSLTYTLIRNRNFNNELMQVSVNMSDAEGAVFRYDYRSTWSDYLYNGLYSELTNLKDVYALANKEDANNNASYRGISLIMQVWAYSILTDTYGDIPYFQSNAGKDSLNFEPAFTPQREIYLDFFKKLEEANTLLALNESIVAASDPVYNGSISNWRRFGNSLYLRLLLRVSGKQEVSAAAMAKIKEILEINTAQYPIISSNAQSAILRWTGVAPYTNPLISVREQDFRQPGLASFFIDNLVNWNDPRIDIPTYGTSGYNRWGIAPVSGQYTGIPSGYHPNDNPVKGSYFYSITSPVSIQNEQLGGMMMNFAEVNFIIAEAALKGWISKSAGEYYNAGALNSITLWLPNWESTVNPQTNKLNTIQDFLTAADIEWDDNLSFEEKMQRIHLQKYYALFLVDMQQWFEYRRTGHPNLPKGPGLKNNGVMPARMVYPVYVQSTNPTNYQAAVAAQGPDVISTMVWWQKP